MICSRCSGNHMRKGQRLCCGCHAASMREHRARVKQAASAERDFIPHETVDFDELNQIAGAVASLEGRVGA